MESLRNKTAELTNKFKKDKPKIAVCIPVYNSVSANWLIQFMRFLKANESKYNINIYMHEQQPVSESRNSLARMALEGGDPDYIFWMDSDNSVPTDAIDHLLSSMEEKNADLMTALYFIKSPPYFPVLRKYESDTFVQIANVEYNQVMRVDGCGMGCCLVKADVFDKIEFPYFKFSHEVWGYKDIVLSEDLYFCRQLSQKGLQLYANTGVISGHIGGTVDIMEYNSFKPLRVSFELERDELVRDLIEFTGKSKKEVEQEISVGPGLMKAAWEKDNPQTPEEKKEFYKKTDRYLYDLACWHFGNRRDYDNRLMAKLKKQKDQKGSLSVLDVAAGIGQNSIMLARLGIDVTIADLESATLNFAEHRFKKNNVPYKVWKMEEEPPSEKYDIILIFDVLEHISEGEAENLVNKILKMKKEGTVVLMSNSFGKNIGGKDSHPMHYDRTEKYDKLVSLLVKS